VRLAVRLAVGLAVRLALRLAVGTLLGRRRKRLQVGRWVGGTWLCFSVRGYDIDRGDGAIRVVQRLPVYQILLLAGRH